MVTVKVMRGCSGSGKSTYVKNNFPNAYICSADDFWINPMTGAYEFDINRHGESHAWCLRKFIDMVTFWSSPGDVTIVVDNTNTTVAELAPYCAIATAYGCDLEIITIETEPDTAGPRNVHNVPEKVISGQYRNLVHNTDRIPRWWKHTRLGDQVPRS